MYSALRFACPTLLLGIAGWLGLEGGALPSSRLLGLPLLFMPGDGTVESTMRTLGFVLPVLIASLPGCSAAFRHHAAIYVVACLGGVALGSVELVAVAILASLAVTRERSRAASSSQHSLTDRPSHFGSMPALFEAGADGLLTIDGDGTILAANPAAARLLGEGLVGRPLERYWPMLRGRPADLARLVGRVFETEIQHESSYLRPAEISLGGQEGGDGWRGILRVSDAAARRARLDELERLALHDGLTGLPNRKSLHDALEAALKTSADTGEACAVMLLDLDKFKQVNDDLGHHVGDLLLQAVGPRLRGPLRDTDLVARLGAGRFAILLPAPMTLAGAATVAERLVEAINEPFMIDGMRLELGVSVGIAVCPDHGDDRETLLQNADVAMDRAKRDRLGYSVFDSERHGEGSRRRTLQRELRDAINGDAIKIALQPKMRAGTDRVSGAEVSVRWHHPMGVLSPEVFVPTAEQTGLIQPLTLAVLNQALDTQRRWRLDGHDLPLAINLSPKWLQDRTFPKILGLLLRNWNGRAERLTLEVPEHAVARDPDTALYILQALADMGVSLSLDGFGTGHSSLPMLQRLPIHELKIAPSFVNSITSDKNAAVVVRSIVQLAHGLGLRVVGEGVASDEVAAWLVGLGCDELQGELVGGTVEPEIFYARHLGASTVGGEGVPLDA